MTTNVPIHREEVARRREAIAELTRAGLSAPEIAIRLNVTARTVVRHRALAGVSKPTHPRLTEEQLATARRLIDEGAPYKEIARTIGCHECTVAQRFPGRGWTRKQIDEWRRERRLWADAS
ncbi:helix-turn-helix DNA binding protein [Gordonia phage Utz]|uniref:DNA binding protein n=1 Tax=Gordonia phage Utz TaxID=1838081 RepID=UPI0007B62C71|nr:DNA binding protein [Gordonia phage Utz]ANA86911.1 helix-turn-helix DNA binding protein [Gordonia phage Utz]ATN90857.1 helix-turn-helix DNA binding protein [Gordonia phage Lysidious]